MSNRQAVALFGVLVLGVVYLLNRIRKPPRKLPPGPTGLPLLGNVFQLGKFPWLTFEPWKDKYGKYLHCSP